MTIAWIAPILRPRRESPDRRARRQAHRRRFALEQFEDRTLLSNWIGGTSGDWNIATNWDDGVPSATNPAVIDGNFAVTIDITNAAAKSLTLSGGAELTGGSLDVRGNFTVDTASDFNIDTVTFNGNGTRSVDAGGSSFTDLVINIPDNGLLTFVGDTDITGDLTFNKLSRLKAGALNLGGDLTSNVASFSGSGTVVFVGEGNDQTINAGGETGLVPGLAFNKTDGSVTIGSNPLNILGGWVVHEGNTATINTAGTDIRFVGHGARTIDAGGLHFNNVQFGITDQGILTVVGDLPIDGNLSIGKSFKGISGGNITVQGDIYTESGTSSMGSGVITLTGSKAQVISSGDGGGSLLGLTFQKSGGSVTIDSGSNLRLSRGLIVDQASKIPFNAAGSTIQFHGANTRTIDTDYATLGSVEFKINGQAAVTVDKMKVGGDLTIIAADKINGPLGAITVAGNLTSKDTSVKGTADITMLNGPTATITAAPGDFPNGGIVIKKGPASLNANMTTPLDGPLTIESVWAINKGAAGAGLTGELVVGKNVITKTGMGGNAMIVFAGNGLQTLTASAPGAGVVGVKIAQESGGSFKLDTSASDGTLRVNGSWIVDATKADNINLADSAIRFTAASGGGITVDTGSSVMTFNDVEVAIGSFNLNAVNMIVDGKLTLTSVYYVKGVITANGDVNTAADYAISSEGGAIEFAGTGDQHLKATVANAGVPAVVVNKPSGTLTLAASNKIRVAGNWTWIKGAVDASGSTVRLTNAKTINTGDIGSSHRDGMKFNNFEIAVGANTLGITNKLTVLGDLTIASAWAINAADGAITVGGSLTSKVIASDQYVGGSANITMVGGNDARIEGGDFPNGGIIINKSGATVDTEVTRPLDGPLTLQSVKALTGQLQVGRDVTTNLTNIGGNNNGTPVLVFKGNKAQSINTGNTDNKMLPGIAIDKSGGSLTINNDLKVGGSWIVADTNNAPVNIAAGATTTFYETSETARTIDIGGTEGFQNVVMRGQNGSDVTIGKMVVKGNLTFLNRNYKSFDGGPIDVYGDVDTSISAGLDGATASIRFVGDGDQTLKANANLTRVPNIIIDKTGDGKLTIDNTPQRAIRVMGNWTYERGNVDATGSSIFFSGNNLTVRPGTMVFYNVDFTYANGLEILDTEGDAGELLYAQGGTIKKLKTPNVVKGSARQV